MAPAESLVSRKTASPASRIVQISVMRLKSAREISHFVVTYLDPSRIAAKGRAKTMRPVCQPQKRRTTLEKKGGRDIIQCLRVVIRMVK